MRTQKLILIALFAVLTAVGARITVPLPMVPFTLQYLVCALGAVLLGRWLGMAAQALYVGMGLIGLPVFATGGGIGYVMSPTFGYLLGFMASAWVIGSVCEHYATRKGRPSVWILLAASVLGLAALYTFGVGYLYLMQHVYLGNSITFSKALMSGAVVFLPADGIKCVLIALIGARMIPALSPVLRVGYLARLKKKPDR